MPITIRTVTEVELDTAWVDQILVTAFDGGYGGCWYWINEAGLNGECWLGRVRILTAEDGDSQRDDAPGPWARVGLQLVDPEEFPVGEQRAAALMDDQGWAWVDATRLSWAVGHVLNDEHLSKTETARQVRRALEEEGEHPGDTGGPDLDTEAADVLVQVALFGEIVYG